MKTVPTQQSTIWWVFLLQGLAGVLLGAMLITQPGATLDRTSLFQIDKPLISLSFVEGEGSLTGYDPG